MSDQQRITKPKTIIFGLVATLMNPLLTQAGSLGEVTSDHFSWHNLYIGIDGGYSMSLNSTNFTPYNGGAVPSSGAIISVPGNTTFQRDVGDAGMIGAFIGYRVDDNLSFNLNYDYRSGFGWQVPTNAALTSGINDLVDYVNNIRIQTLFVNFVLNPDKDTGGWGKLTPYVTAGLGVAFNSTGTLHSVDLLDQTIYSNISGASVVNFAWNAGLGVDYALTKKLHYTLGYRFVNSGALQTSGDLVNPLGSFTTNPFKANRVLLNEVITGLKWQFDA